MKIKIEYGTDKGGYIVAATYFGGKIFEASGSSAEDAKRFLIEKVKVHLSLPDTEIVEVAKCSKS